MGMHSYGSTQNQTMSNGGKQIFLALKVTSQ